MKKGIKITDTTGLVFSKWTIIDGTTIKYVKCRCSCGKIKMVREDSLKRGEARSCRNCMNNTHKMTESRPYRCWSGMMSRCFNKNEISYKNYGGRGITVCKKWLKFEGFWKDMKDSYADNLSIERLNNDKGYSKKNCKWATVKEQANNRRSNHLITFRGKTQNLSEWANELGVTDGCLYMRLKRGKDILNQ